MNTLSSPSLKSLWKISLPLMISAFATLFMLFVDRYFLASYSLDALNASTKAGTLAWAFAGGFSMITAISEALVAQYNGAKIQYKIGIPVWQTIWIALVSIIFFVPTAIWLKDFFFIGSKYAHLEKIYFSILMLSGPVYALFIALGGFYIGRGKTKIILFLAVGANIVNIILDKILIFGIKDLISPMGIKGAAIATCTGNLFQAIILLICFLHKKNIVFGNYKYKIDIPTLKKCFSIGIPQAIFYFLEIFGWAIFYQIMSTISEIHITISSLCHSMIILLFFFIDGIYKGTLTICGNLIGSAQHDKVKILLKNAIKIIGVFCLFFSIFFIIYPHLLLDNLPGHLKQIVGNNPYILKIPLIYTLIYLFFEGIRWVLAAILGASGDTLFLMIYGTFSIWIFLIAPIYFFVKKYTLSPNIAWMIAFIYSFLLSGIYLIRFIQGKWKKINILPEKEIL